MFSHLNKDSIRTCSIQFVKVICFHPLIDNWLPVLRDCLTLLPSVVEIIKFSTEEPFRTFLLWIYRKDNGWSCCHTAHCTLHVRYPVLTTVTISFWITALSILFSIYIRNKDFSLDSSAISLPFLPLFTLLPPPDREDQGFHARLGVDYSDWHMLSHSVRINPRVVLIARLPRGFGYPQQYFHDG
jgi:hypothetical protein